MATITVPDKQPAPDVKPATLGRTVHYYGKETCSATVSNANADGMTVNLSILQDGAAGWTFAANVPHKSIAKPGHAYWDWPEIK